MFRLRCKVRYYDIVYSFKRAWIKLYAQGTLYNYRAYIDFSVSMVDFHGGEAGMAEEGKQSIYVVEM